MVLLSLQKSKIIFQCSSSIVCHRLPPNRSQNMYQYWVPGSRSLAEFSFLILVPKKKLHFEVTVTFVSFICRRSRRRRRRRGGGVRWLMSVAKTTLSSFTFYYVFYAVAAIAIRIPTSNL